MASSKQIVQVIQNFRKNKLAFVQEIAELAIRPENVNILLTGNIIEMLKPLVTDVCPQIQQCAFIALGRISHERGPIAMKVLDLNILPILFTDLDERDKYQKKAILFLLRCICKHGYFHCRKVVQNDGVLALLACFEDIDPMVKEGAAWVLGYICRSSRDLSYFCVEYGTVPRLVKCLQHSSLNVQLIATSALADIAKHSARLALNILDAGAVYHLVPNLRNKDERLKRQILNTLSQLAKHNSYIAGGIVETEVLPLVLVHLGHTNPLIARNAACVVRDVVRHSEQLSRFIVNIGGVEALLQVVQHIDECKAPAITALGYMAAYSPKTAEVILTNPGFIEFSKTLSECNDDTTLAVTAWALGQLGHHSPQHAQVVTYGNTLTRMAYLMKAESSSANLKFKSRYALKMILHKCLLLSALEPLLAEDNPEILKYVLRQYSKVIPTDLEVRRQFVTSGALKRVQEIQASPGSSLMDMITVINAAYPDEVVRFFTPGYPETLLNAVDAYKPQSKSMYKEIGRKDTDMIYDMRLPKQRAERSTSMTIPTSTSKKTPYIKVSPDKPFRTILVKPKE